MNNSFDDKSLDQIFDDNKLNQAIKEGKKKSTKKTILISLAVATLVFGLLTVVNTFLVFKLSDNAFQQMDAYVRLTVPNGYISSSVDTLNYFGGRSFYTISRTVGNRPVLLENRVKTFGLLPRGIITRGQGGLGHISGDWPASFWEYGYNKMIFFHPQIAYKEYKNDLVNLRDIPDYKLIEVGISLDKPYTISELSKIFPDVSISWYWVDAFRDEDMERYENESRKHDAKEAYLSEFEVIGVNLIDGRDSFEMSYAAVITHLKNSKNKKFIDIYNNLFVKGHMDSSKVPILGFIAYGTKHQIETLIDNPHIRASSFGVIINKY